MKNLSLTNIAVPEFTLSALIGEPVPIVNTVISFLFNDKLF
jgi:hypothetical protein